MNVEAWIMREKKGFLTRALLTLPSFLFGTLVRLRNIFYEKSILSIQRLPLFVISIGNLVAGGTGKTPITAFLVNKLRAFGKIAILSRGYRSEAEKGNEPRVVSYGDGPILSWEEAGDEAYLLAKKCPGSIVISGRDRIRGANLAAALGAVCVVLDDGMQHRRLFRNKEIALVDSDSPFGGGYFLPRGSLRDEPRRIKDANLIIVIGDKIPCELKSAENVVRANRSFKDIIFNEGVLTSIENRRVALFSGIGNPLSFEKLIRGLSAEIISIMKMGDHRTCEMHKLYQFAKEAKNKGAEMILCTEKDWLKLDKKVLRDFPLPVGRVRIEISFLERGDLIENWVEKIGECLAL